jgi:hypothetical protein
MMLFRCSGVPCSGVPLFRCSVVPVFLVLLIAPGNIAELLVLFDLRSGRTYGTEQLLCQMFPLPTTVLL